MKKSCGQPDYRSIRLEGGEFTVAIGICIAAVVWLAVFFFRSLWAVPVLLPVGYFLLRVLQKRKSEQVRRELTEQFKECILSVTASLQAGYAVENAFLESRKDISSLYGEEAFLYRELEGIRRGLGSNIPLEKLLQSLGERSGCREIGQFATLFGIAKRGGGDLPGMIRTCAGLISQKLEMRQEIRILLAGRRMEQNIMRAMPFGILLYVGSTNPGYFDPLYHSPGGVLTMSLCLGGYLAAVWIGEKIFEGIERQLEGEMADKDDFHVKGKRNRKLRRLLLKLYLEGRKTRVLRNILEKIRKALHRLWPLEDQEELVVSYFCQKVEVSLMTAVAGCLLGGGIWLKNAGDPAGGKKGLLLMGLGLITAVVIFFLKDRDLFEQVKKKQELLRLAYPDFLYELTLFLVSGLPIRSAFVKLGEEHLLARQACREMQMGLAEVTVYEHLGKQAGCREYMKLGMLLCQNVKKGNAALLLRLEEEAMQAADAGIQGAKQMGEETGTKLLIPMVMLLAVVMIIIMIPAFSMMG